MKAIRYSKCLDGMYSLYRTTAHLPERERIPKVIDIVEEGMAGYDRKNNRAVDSGSIMGTTVRDAAFCLHADIRNKALHVFLADASVLEFLEETEFRDVEKTVDGFEGLGFEEAAETARSLFPDPESEPEETRQIARDLLDGLRLERCVVLCLHLPDRTGDHTYYAGLGFDGNFHVMSITDAGFSFDNINGADDLERANELSALRLAFNTIAYMDAFPECVKDGLPKGFRFDNSSPSRKLRLSANEFVRQYAEHKRLGHTVSPHFRSGHFRYLKSEFFRNKRGQFVYVKPTVVNAKNAKTIEERGNSAE